VASAVREPCVLEIAIGTPVGQVLDLAGGPAAPLHALPELITLDDWGFPIVSGQPVPPPLWPDARETVRACPLLALRLERVNR